MGVAAAAPFLTSCKDKSLLANLASGNKGNDKVLFFEPLAATDKDEFLIPKGFKYDILRSWKDPLGADKTNPIKFGTNNDFTAFFPLDKSKSNISSDQSVISQKQMAKNASRLSDEGLLWVNHECLDPAFIPDLNEQRKSVGGSVIKVRKEKINGDLKWNFIPDDKYSRRFDADTPFEMTGPSKTIYPKVNGTLANCSGGQTPWMTVLSGEENFHLFDSAYGWKNFNREHYGWVIEVDPYDKDSTPKKHTALGRFAHENAASVVSKNKRVVVYMGDDKKNEHIYKFISKATYNSNSREMNMDLLHEGDLYVAKLEGRPKAPGTEGLESGKGSWELLSVESNKKLLEEFKSQANMLIHTRDAAKLLEATPLDRAEDLEVCPHDGSVFVALTENKNRKNYFGSILRIYEDNDNHEATSFRFENFLMGGDGMACPDNFAFDNRGNIWVTSDISSSKTNKGDYKKFGNNSLFVIPLFGESAGIPKRFASAPRGAELTGPWFNPNCDTLFLSVQHPGEDVESVWPGKKGDIPKSSVVAITGF